MRRICFLIIGMLLIAQAGFCATNLIGPNADFSKGLDGWELYGRDKDRIKAGDNCAIVPSGHASIAWNMPLEAGRVYELSFKFLRSSPATSGHLVFFYNVTGGLNASAGITTLDFPRRRTGDLPSGWETFRGTLRTPRMTQGGKLVLSTEGLGEIRYAQVSLTEAPSSKAARMDIPTTDLSFLPKVRTERPLYEELLAGRPGNYTVIAWTHHLNRAKLPPEQAARMTDELWKEEERKSFDESRDSRLWLYRSPGGAEQGRALWEKLGIKFDIMCEHSGVMAEAIRRGGELLNPVASSTTSAEKRCSLIDPHYVEAAVDTLTRQAAEYKGQPYINVFQGKDEPSIALPEGPADSWGPFWRQCAREVLTDYGFGRYAIPAPGDPEFLRDAEHQPLRWIAFNRWMARKYLESKRTMHAALKSLDPTARYNVCDYWFMSGFVQYDFAGMARFSDIVECDPYASSGERTLGRGLYNHGFGVKFLRDITGRPVRSIVQAFDYAGYAMSPEDLREWVSQSLRAGAAHISYYQMDNPKYTDNDRWKMMLHLSKVVTGMRAIQLPDDPDAAILYCADSHRAHGAATHADEIYTAYSFLGERAGSWFRFVDDDSLARGGRSLSGYKAVYVPLGKYQHKSVCAKLDEYVRGGGVIIGGDPEIFSLAPDGTSLSAVRERIFGVKVLGPKTRDSLTLGNAPWLGKAAGLTLPVYRPVGRDGWYQENGCSVRVMRKDVQVLAKFIDGTPAITVAPYGRGKAIYFAANPFVPEALCQGDGWNAFFHALQQHLGAKVDRDIWQFKLPAPT